MRRRGRHPVIARPLPRDSCQGCRLPARTRALPRAALASALALAGSLALACAALRETRLERDHGRERAQERQVVALPAGAVDYDAEVRPILAARCVVCHACYDAPCQLKLGSSAGIDRGGNTDEVYDALRLRQADPTRLFEDAATTTAWRSKNFHPVLNERRQSREQNREGSVLYQLLALKRANPLAPGTLLPADIDLRLRHDEQCPTLAELPRHTRKHPGWGMPYGLPALDEREHQLITRWLEEGARQRPPAPLPPADIAQIAAWEAFLNQDTLKARLAARYIYEHLFLAHVHFTDDTSAGPPQFYKLIRSTTPPGQPPAIIATRRPYDDPGVERPYYRLVPEREAIVAKLHLPYRFDAARMQRWTELFHAADYSVAALPSYAPEVASNPFIAFRAIPVPNRHRFLIDEAEFTMMGFIKGAVCRGPIALNVIDDHFNVFFVDPDAPTRLHDAEFLFKHADVLRMPAEASSNARPLATWLRQSRREKAYAAIKQQALRDDAAAGGVVDIRRLWDGDGHNPNASLTVFRHFDSATVVKGMVGGDPRTTWVLDYPLFERIHYLLVAGYDVYGNVGHHLATRTYMDFLRMESEFMFLAFLPTEVRGPLRQFWYRDTRERAYRDIVDALSGPSVDSQIRFTTDKPEPELYRRIADHLAPTLTTRFRLTELPLAPAAVAALHELDTLAGVNLQWLPQVGFIHVPDAPPGAQVFSILRNDGHTNIASPFFEKDRRTPAEDTLTVVRGFIGAHPNAFYVVPQARLPEFVAQVAGLTGEPAYAALQQTFGVRRTDPEFWPTSDRLAQIYQAGWPIEAGLLDLNRYENR